MCIFTNASIMMMDMMCMCSMRTMMRTQNSNSPCFISESERRKQRLDPADADLGSKVSSQVRFLLQ